MENSKNTMTPAGFVMTHDNTVAASDIVVTDDNVRKADRIFWILTRL